MVLAPDDGVGVIALANTGRFRPDVPQQPAQWPDLCGRYTLRPGVLVDPQPRMLFGAGLRVAARLHHLSMRVPGTPLAFPLHPDEDDDPEVFRADLRRIGGGLPRVAFTRDESGRAAALDLHLGRHPLTLRRRRGGTALSAPRRGAAATPSAPR